MSRAVVITSNQAAALKALGYGQAITATDFDRSSLESLVNRGMAFKHRVGHQVTYTISQFGTTVLKSL